MAKYKLMLEVDTPASFGDMNAWLSNRDEHCADDGPCTEYTIANHKIEEIAEPVIDIGIGVKAEQADSRTIKIWCYNKDQGFYLDKNCINKLATLAGKLKGD